MSLTQTDSLERKLDGVARSAAPITSMATIELQTARDDSIEEHPASHTSEDLDEKYDERGLLVTPPLPSPVRVEEEDQSMEIKVSKAKRKILQRLAFNKKRLLTAPMSPPTPTLLGDIGAVVKSFEDQLWDNDGDDHELIAAHTTPNLVVTVRKPVVKRRVNLPSSMVVSGKTYKSALIGEEVPSPTQERILANYPIVSAKNFVKSEKATLPAGRNHKPVVKRATVVTPITPALVPPPPVVPRGPEPPLEGRNTRDIEEGTYKPYFVPVADYLGYTHGQIGQPGVLDYGYMISGKNYLRVMLPIAVLRALQGWWSGRETTYENYLVSVQYCRNMCRKIMFVDGAAEARTMMFAPYVAYTIGSELRNKVLASACGRVRPSWPMAIAKTVAGISLALSLPSTCVAAAASSTATMAATIGAVTVGAPVLIAGAALAVGYLAGKSMLRHLPKAHAAVEAVDAVAVAPEQHPDSKLKTVPVDRAADRKSPPAIATGIPISGCEPTVYASNQRNVVAALEKRALANPPSCNPTYREAFLDRTFQRIRRSLGRPYVIQIPRDPDDWLKHVLAWVDHCGSRPSVKKRYRESAHWLYDHGYTAHSELPHDLVHQWTTREVTVKRETVLKDSDGAPRQIMSATPYFVVMVAPFIKDFTGLVRKQLQRKPKRDTPNYYAPGAHGRDMAEMHLIHELPHKRNVDQAKWDASQGVDCGTRELRLFREYGIPRGAFQLIEYNLAGIHGYSREGVVFRGPYMRQSGDPHTTVGNTMLAGAVRVEIVADCLGRSPTIEDCFDSAGGDDGVLMSRDPLDQFETIAATVGFPVTSMKVSNMEDLEFLGCRWTESSIGPVYVPMAGRTIAKLAYSVNATQENAAAIARGAALSFAHSASAVPPLMSYISTILRLTEGVQEIMPPDEPWKMTAGFTGVPTDATWAHLDRVYGWTRELQAVLEDRLSEVSSLGQVVDIPCLKMLVDRDFNRTLPELSSAPPVLEIKYDDEKQSAQVNMIIRPDGSVRTLEHNGLTLRQLIELGMSDGPPVDFEDTQWTVNGHEHGLTVPVSDGAVIRVNLKLLGGLQAAGALINRDDLDRRLGHDIRERGCGVLTIPNRRPETCSAGLCLFTLFRMGTDNQIVDPNRFIYIANGRPVSADYILREGDFAEIRVKGLGGAGPFGPLTLAETRATRKAARKAKKAAARTNAQRRGGYKGNAGLTLAREIENQSRGKPPPRSRQAPAFGVAKAGGGQSGRSGSAAKQSASFSSIDFWQNVPAGNYISGQVVLATPVVPGQMGPWLQTQLQLWEKWKVTSMVMSYVPSVGTTTAGNFIMFFDPDPTTNWLAMATGADTVKRAFTQTGRVDFAMWQDAKCTNPCRVELFTQASGSDPRFFQAGTFVLMCVTSCNLSSDPGALHMSWSVSVRNKTFNQNATSETIALTSYAAPGWSNPSTDINFTLSQLALPNLGGIVASDNTSYQSEYHQGIPAAIHYTPAGQQLNVVSPLWTDPTHQGGGLVTNPGGNTTFFCLPPGEYIVTGTMYQTAIANAAPTNNSYFSLVPITANISGVNQVVFHDYDEAIVTGRVGMNNNALQQGGFTSSVIVEVLDDTEVQAFPIDVSAASMTSGTIAAPTIKQGSTKLSDDWGVVDFLLQAVDSLIATNPVLETVMSVANIASSLFSSVFFLSSHPKMLKRHMARKKTRSVMRFASTFQSNGFTPAQIAEFKEFLAYKERLIAQQSKDEKPVVRVEEPATPSSGVLVSRPTIQTTSSAFWRGAH